MDKVSIITTFYNAENYIEAALSSILKQEVDDTFTIEYIIVDDKSKDGSRKIVDDFVMNNSWNNISVRIIEPIKNLGCGGARKFGIEAATGDYFMFLDADDYYINSDFVKRAHEDINKYEADIVEYGMVYNNSDGTKVNVVAPKDCAVHTRKDAELALFADNLIKFNVWTKIYRRSIVESYTYSDSRTFEDVRTIPHWIANAKKIAIRATAEINYRASNGSIINNDYNDTRIGTISAICELFESFKDEPKVLEAMYSRSMIDLSTVLDGKSSDDPIFNEMSALNTKMLSYIYPDTYKEKTFNL